MQVFSPTEYYQKCLNAPFDFFPSDWLAQWLTLIANMTERMDSAALLAELWKPELHSNIPTWLYSATKPEKKGLRLIAAVLKHKGMKRFRARASASLLPNLDEVRKPKFQTAYAAEFSDIPVASKSHAAIFKYRKLSDLPCAQVLSPIPLRILENWFGLGDETQFPELVLATLRSFLAAAMTSRQKLSESQAQFQGYDYSSLYSNRNMAASARVIRDLRHSKPWVLPDKPETTPIDVPQPASWEDVKRRQVLLMRGSGDVIRGLAQSTEPVLSSYQHTYRTHFTTYTARTKPDFYTSMALGRLCPDQEGLVDPKKVKTARTLSTGT